MIRVLFLCLGNICRSPMAEAVFQQLVKESGLEAIIEADSAGTGGWHAGEQPHSGTCSILAKYDIEFQHLARQIKLSDFEEFDYILTMDESNFEDVIRMANGRAKIVRFMSFAPHGSVLEVPDPFYTGGFEEVFRLVTAGSIGFLAFVREEHQI